MGMAEAAFLAVRPPAISINIDDPTPMQDTAVIELTTTRAMDGNRRLPQASDLAAPATKSVGTPPTSGNRFHQSPARDLPPVVVAYQF
jgi:hypothetical protein